ncbi:MAG: ABC transporter permease [Chitinophagales bacterium]
MLTVIRIFIEGIRLALQELWASKMRSFLSTLGITIGIFCVVSVLMVVDSVERNVKGSFEKLGDDIVYIMREPWDENPAENWWKYIRRPFPNYNEFKAIQEKVIGAEATAIRIVIQGKDIKYKNNTLENVVMVAGSHEFGDIFNMEFERGRYFSMLESQLGNNKVIVGHTIAQELFPNIDDPTGKEVKIMGRKLSIVGVLKEEGKSLLGDGMDEVAILPYNYMRRYIDINSKRVTPAICVKAKEGVPTLQLKEEIRGVLRAKRRLKPKEDDDFAMNQMSILLGFIDNIFNYINGAGWLIGIFSILVGGFGIANIMFVSVKERTGIIGIKKSLGAKNHYILFEFLVEAICLCLVGGLAGLLLVYGLAAIGNAVTDSFELVVSSQNIGIALGLSLGIGVVSGLIPAIKASLMNPVEAIRQNF